MFEFFIGILAGILTNIGLGGGSILILLLTLFTNTPLREAQSANLLCFIPAAIISILSNSKSHLINYKNSIFFILFGCVGSIVGFLISKKLSVTFLKKVFAVFLLIICFFEIYSYYKKYIKGNNKTY